MKIEIMEPTLHQKIGLSPPVFTTLVIDRYAVWAGDFYGGEKYFLCENCWEVYKMLTGE